MLFTPEIIQRAQTQYKRGASFKQTIVAKFFNPVGLGSWWLMNMEPGDNPDYCWGFAEITDFEMGSFSKRELENLKLKVQVQGVGMVEVLLKRDEEFKPCAAWKVWEEKTGLKYNPEDDEDE